MTCERRYDDNAVVEMQRIADECSPAKRAYIYALQDPDSNQVMYVGKTINPKNRFYGHIYDKEDSPKHRWLQSLKAKGKKPLMTVIDECAPSEVLMIEDEWIRAYSMLNPYLTNKANPAMFVMRPDVLCFLAKNWESVPDRESLQCHVCRKGPNVAWYRFCCLGKGMTYWTCLECGKSFENEDPDDDW